MDKQEFGILMAGLAENFSAQLTPAGINLRYEALKGYSYEKIRAASVHILRTRKYTTMPTVADFTEAIDGNLSDVADFQARLVVAEIKRVGNGGSPVFEDSVTQKLISKHFGWSSLCGMLEKELRFFVNDFKTAYGAEKRIQNTQAALPGIENKKQISAQNGGM